jgi:GH24 family phage-related lysozyme (muramidase)
VDEMPGDCAAALVSLVFNRGPDLTGDRRKEMAEIQGLLRVGELKQIPDAIRSMQRLWPDTAGLRRRRREEADLFEAGLVPAGE